MRKAIIPICCLLLAAGCETTASRVRRDPLLLGRKPVMGSSSSAPQKLLTRSEPMPPTLPAAALVLSQQQSGPFGNEQGTVSGASLQVSPGKPQIVPAPNEIK